MKPLEALAALLFALVILLNYSKPPTLYADGSDPMPFCRKVKNCGH